MSEDEIENDVSNESDQHLTFVLSEEEFAIPVMTMREIIQYDHMTTVPMVPAFIQGVVNLRGNVVPVISLSNKFALQPQPIDKRTCIIIMDIQLEGEAVVMGVVVDKVLQVIEIPEESIEPPPALGATIRTDFIKGMGKLDNNFIIILDVARVLSAKEISIMHEINKNDNAE